MRLLRKLLRRREVRELSDEERVSLAVEREQRERDRRRGEAYIGTYAEPAANWGRDADVRDVDI